VSPPGGGAPDGSSPDGGGDAGSPDAGAPDAGPALSEGVLLFGAATPLAGIHYQSGSASGFTDPAGRFQYSDSVTFTIAGLELATISGAPFVTPFTLAGSCAAADPLRKLLIFIESVGWPAPAFHGELAGLRLADMTRPQMTEALAQIGKTPIAEQDALDRFIREVDSEEWAESSRDTFGPVESAVRSQGVATDGTSWFFSWRYGLQRTDSAYSVQKNNDTAIPAQLALSGSDHIGDIDVGGGVLYAGIEDSKAYAHPRVGLFDAASLQFQKSYDLPVARQPDGVPWIAVDGDAGEVYTSPWNPTPVINVWDLQLRFLRAVALSPAISRVQGAKPVQGMMYAAYDVTPKQIVKVNLETGTVLPLFQIDATHELEGLAWRAGALHTLDANLSATAMEFRHHQRTRAAWREQICPRGN
jgi:hypothetical protein